MPGTWIFYSCGSCTAARSTSFSTFPELIFSQPQKISAFVSSLTTPNRTALLLSNPHRHGASGDDNQPISCQAAVQSSSVCARDLCPVYLRLENPAISTAGSE